MQRPPNLSTSAGVFAVVHKKTKIAYIGFCSNLIHRATIWARYFRQKKDDPNYKIPIANIPDYPSDEWAFMQFLTDDVEKTREVFAKADFTIINQKTKSRKLITFRGKTARLGEHAKDAGISYATVYRRLGLGKTLEEALTVKDD